MDKDDIQPLDSAPVYKESQQRNQETSLFITQENIAPGSLKQRHMVSSPTQIGDMYFGRDGNSFGNLPIGTTGQLLTVDSGLPVWQTYTPPVVATDGWSLTTVVLTYSSADAPTFIATTASNLTSVISVGMKLKLTQTTVKYFIVTAIDATTITLYGGTDYTLANAAISLVSYSSARTPLSFPTSPLKWQVKVTDSTSRTQATPSASTWYNLGSQSIVLPIGLWNVDYCAYGRAIITNTFVDMQLTLSTANNSQSDSELTYSINSTLSSNLNELYGEFARNKVIGVASKTSYFLNAETTTTSVTSIGTLGTMLPTVIRAVCAYL